MGGGLTLTWLHLSTTPWACLSRLRMAYVLATLHICGAGPQERKGRAAHELMMHAGTPLVGRPPHASILAVHHHHRATYVVDELQRLEPPRPLLVGVLGQVQRPRRRLPHRAVVPTVVAPGCGGRAAAVGVTGPTGVVPTLLVVCVQGSSSLS